MIPVASTNNDVILNEAGEVACLSELPLGAGARGCPRCDPPPVEAPAPLPVAAVDDPVATIRAAYAANPQRYALRIAAKMSSGKISPTEAVLLLEVAAGDADTMEEAAENLGIWPRQIARAA